METLYCQAGLPPSSGRTGSGSVSAGLWVECLWNPPPTLAFLISNKCIYSASTQAFVWFFSSFWIQGTVNWVNNALKTITTNSIQHFKFCRHRKDVAKIKQLGCQAFCVLSWSSCPRASWEITTHWQCIITECKTLVHTNFGSLQWIRFTFPSRWCWTKLSCHSRCCQQ